MLVGIHCSTILRCQMVRAWSLQHPRQRRLSLFPTIHHDGHHDVLRSHSVTRTQVVLVTHNTKTSHTTKNNSLKPHCNHEFAFSQEECQRVPSVIQHSWARQQLPYYTTILQNTFSIVSCEELRNQHLIVRSFQSLAMRQPGGKGTGLERNEAHANSIAT